MLSHPRRESLLSDFVSGYLCFYLFLSDAFSAFLVPSLCVVINRFCTFEAECFGLCVHSGDL